MTTENELPPGQQELKYLGSKLTEVHEDYDMLCWLVAEQDRQRQLAEHHKNDKNQWPYVDHITASKFLSRCLVRYEQLQATIRGYERQGQQPPATDESWEIKTKHALLDAVWSVRNKGYDNEYAVAYQMLREVFDATVLPFVDVTRAVDQNKVDS